MAPELSSPAASDVRALRGFSRMYTKIVGTLEEGLLSTRYTLAQARVLYELATRESPKAGDIAHELGMDPGYLSRILTGFHASGLLKRRVSAQDARATNLVLTRAGRQEFRALDRASEQQAASLLTGLLPFHRDRLIQCLTTTEALLRQPENSLPPFVLRTHRPGDMGWVVHREAAVYAEEYGFDESFEALVAQIVADFIRNFDPAHERCWIAESGGAHAGHIFLVGHPDRPQTAKLRLLLVEPSARGMGVGQALVSECIRFARDSGYRTITLWTQSILAAAHTLYQRAGFRLVSEEPHKSFGQNLIGQTWELDLHAAARS